MTAYANRTRVPIPQSRTEIERTLERFGADQIVTGIDPRTAQGVVRFRAHERFYHLDVNPPPRKTLSEAQHDQAKRSHWRAVCLWIKAINVAIEAGILSVEEAFLPYTLLPDGGTVKAFLEPQVERAYESGDMPSLLPGVAGALPRGG